MTETSRPDAILAADAPLRAKVTNYPPPFAARVAGREKQPLGDLFGLTNFGVNLTRLRPGAISALHHRHSRQDEMIYVLDGHPTLVVDDRVTELAPGMCAGFSHGGASHHIENRTDADVVMLEIGDRTAGDEGSYPDDDIKAVRVGDGWRFAHKDGTPY